MVTLSSFPESSLSQDDMQLIKTHHFGTPLGVYRVKPDHIRYLYGSNLVLIVMSVLLILLVPFLMVLIPHWYSDLIWYAFFLGFIGIIYSGLVLRWEVPRCRRDHVIVCEGGLLQIEGGRFWKTSVVAIQWKEVVRVRTIPLPPNFPCIITYRGRKTLVLTTAHQNHQKRIALIEQQVSLAREARPAEH